MSKFVPVLAGMAMAVSSVLAQPAPAHPGDASAAVPPVGYRSPLADYRRFAEPEVAPWRETNDTAARIGGWKAYAREIAGAASPASPQPAALPKAGNAPDASPHHGH